MRDNPFKSAIELVEDTVISPNMFLSGASRCWPWRLLREAKGRVFVSGFLFYVEGEQEGRRFRASTLTLRNSGTYIHNFLNIYSVVRAKEANSDI